MSAEFHFSPLTLIPCRRSLAQKRDKKITHYTVETSLACTHETLLATNGLLAMLLHWATTAQIYRERRIHARRMLEDILRRVLSAADKKTQCGICSLLQASPREPLGFWFVTTSTNSSRRRRRGTNRLRTRCYTCSTTERRITAYGPISYVV